MRVTRSRPGVGSLVGSVVLAVGLTGLLGASAYDARAAQAPSPAAAHRATTHTTGFVAPVPHRYGANGPLRFFVGNSRAR
jgi:hypothetical protein